MRGDGVGSLVRGGEERSFEDRERNMSAEGVMGIGCKGEGKAQPGRAAGTTGYGVRRGRTQGRSDLQGKPSSSRLQSTKPGRGRISRSIASTQFEESFVGKMPRPSLAVGRVSFRSGEQRRTWPETAGSFGRAGKYESTTKAELGLDVAGDRALGAQWTGGEGGKTK